MYARPGSAEHMCQHRQLRHWHQYSKSSCIMEEGSAPRQNRRRGY